MNPERRPATRQSLQSFPSKTPRRVRGSTKPTEGGINFMGEITTILSSFLPDIPGGAAERFERYHALLLEYNARMNLTALTEAKDVAAKHFCDSVLPRGLIPQGAACIDVGTGAGFPGVPLLILRPDLQMTLLDSTNKKLDFVEIVLKELSLHATVLRMRAEDAGRSGGHRGRYDMALSRAVASTSVLLELTVPLLRVGGASLMYKGPRAKEELSQSGAALAALGASAQIVPFEAPWGDRSVIVAKKTAHTAKTYPRNMSAILKKPL